MSLRISSSEWFSTTKTSSLLARTCVVGDAGDLGDLGDLDGVGDAALTLGVVIEAGVVGGGAVDAAPQDPPQPTSDAARAATRTATRADGSGRLVTRPKATRVHEVAVP